MSRLLLERHPIHLTKFQKLAADRLYEPCQLTNVQVERIWYLSDGLRVAGYLAMPIHKGRKLPLLIWNRGGNGDRGALDDLTAYLILGIAASWGMVVLATQYRGNKGSEGIEDWGGEDVRDAFHLREVAVDIPECDPSRCALEGASRGGMTTYRLLTMFSDISAVMIHAGIADLRELVRAKPRFQEMIDQYLGDLSEHDRERGLDLRSMTRFADTLPQKSPILLVHGDADTVVPLSQSRIAAQALAKVGIPHELVVIPGADHVALKDGSYLEVDTLRRNWYAKHGLISL